MLESHDMSAGGPPSITPSEMTAVGCGGKLVMVEGLAVCDWAVGQASAGHGQAIPPSLWRKELPVDWPGEEGKGAFCQPWTTAGPLNLEEREPHTIFTPPGPCLSL